MTPPDAGSWDGRRSRWTAPDAAPGVASVVIAADWAPIRAFAVRMEREPVSVYGDLLPELRSADLRIVNLECALSDTGAPVCKSGAVFRGSPAHAAALAAVPFEVATLANNHVFDYGLESFRQTLDVLAANGIRAVGAGMNAAEAQRPLAVTAKGVRIGIVNFSEGEDLTAAGDGPGVVGWDVEAAAARVRAARAAADVVVVIAHAGLEYIPFPPPYVVDAFRRMAEAGADLVIGHHPHVPQGIEIRGRTPICYSLGNFAFYQETDLHYRKVGYLMKAGVSRQGLAGIELMPYDITDAGLQRLAGAAADDFFAALRRVSRPLSDPGGVEAAWHGFLRWYGRQGFRDEMDRILTKMEEDPPKGAAMLRNRITTMQHREHWSAFLTRVMQGELDHAPDWAHDIAEEWMTRHR